MFRWMIVIFLMTLPTLVLSACNSSSSEPETHPTQVILKLGGENCEFYLGAVDAALKKLKGIQAVDLTTQKGHGIVKTDGSLKASQVVNAVDGLYGEGWKCEAELKN